MSRGLVVVVGFIGKLPVAGVGPYETLLDSYRAAGGQRVVLEELLWWQVAGTEWPCGITGRS